MRKMKQLSTCLDLFYALEKLSYIYIGIDA